MFEQLGQEVFPAELDEIRHRRVELARREGRNAPLPPCWGPPSAAHSLVGLSFSGGGIRSATFCLGVVRYLAKRGLFKSLDYLSTVSGGGYIGACLSSLLNG